MTSASPRAPGDLVDDAHSNGFAYRLLAPDATPRALVVLLHGVGGDELQLAAVAATLPRDVAVALPRGPRTISGERLGWFRVGLGSDPPQVVMDEAEDSRQRLLTLVGHLQSTLDVAPSWTWLAGFSQGGVLAASAALTAPERVAGMAIACGRILPEIEDAIASREAVSHLQALIVHGRDDDTLPPRWADDAAARLDTLGVEHRLEMVDGGHELSKTVLASLSAWLVEHAAR